MRLAYITVEDPANRTGWSGINHYMARGLAGAGCELVPLFGFQEARPAAAMMRKLCARVFLRRFHGSGREPAVLRNYARQIEARVGAAKVDAVLAPGTTLTSHVRLSCPLFFWTDATVPALFRLYPGYDRWTRSSARLAHDADRQALANATAAFFSSSWAAESAVGELGADPARVHVVPFGANLEQEPTTGEALGAAQARPDDRLVLLFAGVHWERKGGAKAVAVAEALHAAGVPVELRILGIDQPPTASPRILSLGRISKATEDGCRRIAEQFAQGHFLLLPTMADCTPVVFAEANAWAMPVVTHRVGGIASQIVNECNGRMFDPAAPAAEIAAWIGAVWRDRPRYLALAASSRHEYETRLNWHTAARQVVAVMRSHVATSPSPVGTT